jgi:insulysin
VEELAAALQHTTADSVRLSHKLILSQLFTEVYTSGNLYKEDATKMTDMVESTLKARPLPPSQWPITRSLILPQGSNYVYKKTLKDVHTANHCVETLLYVGDQDDQRLRAKTLLLEQIISEPVFHQLRTTEQLGYIVFSGMRKFTTTFGLRITVQSNMEPKYIDRRVEAFLAQFGQMLEKMSEEDFAKHKNSLIANRLQKLSNLGQVSARHWGEIESEYYDFELRK